jgi:hypothetical protein
MLVGLMVVAAALVGPLASIVSATTYDFDSRSQGKTFASFQVDDGCGCTITYILP